MAITTKEQGVWNLEEVYNKQNQGGIWDYDSNLYNSWVWGSGELAGNNNPSLRYSSPTQLPGTNWTKLDGPWCGSGGNMVATKTDGSLWVWGGAASYGANGLNSKIEYSSPMQIPGTNWKQATAGYRYCCAVRTDGTLWSWGYGERGVLGLNESGNSSSGSWHSSPTQVPGTTWESVASWGNRTSAFKTDGSLWFWGIGNSTGMFGTNNNTNYSSPTQVPGTWDFNKTQFTSSNSYGVIAWRTDGTLWGWGRNHYGQLLLGDRTQRSSPTQIDAGTWANLTTTYTGLGVKTDGTLWSWGQNTWGQLGLNQPDATKISSPTQIPGKWSTARNAIFVSNYGASAITENGTLFTWGYNGDGQLGLNQAPAQLAQASSPCQVGGDFFEVGNSTESTLGVRSLRYG